MKLPEESSEPKKMKSQYLQSKERKPGTLTAWEIMARQGRGKPIQRI